MTVHDAGLGAVDAGTQILLRLEYQRQAAAGRVLAFPEVGFRNYSQSDEDGILWYLLSLVGETTRFCVELGAGDGSECNTANLILAHHWSHLLVDGDADNVRRGVGFFSRTTLAKLLRPRFEQWWITREDIDTKLAAEQLPEVDVLSIDLDGVDYWIWEAITVVRPRILVMEFNPLWGPEASVTVPYDPSFRAAWRDVPAVHRSPGGPDKMAYFGASLTALTRLSERKGYRLVGTNRNGYNAFFLRADVGADLIAAVTPAAALSQPGATALSPDPYRAHYPSADPHWRWEQV